MPIARPSSGWLVFAAALLFAPNPLMAQSAEDALKAYNSGDYARALEIVSPLADAGDTKAQVILGTMYIAGRGVPKDPVKGCLLLRSAAERGDAVAQYRLGAALSQGVGGTRDLAEAARWIEKSAEQGYPDAQFKIGLIYQHGDGVAPDAAKGVEWLRRAAERGHADAQVRLAAALEVGAGTERNIGESVHWMEKAAMQGHPVAQYSLAVAYHFGRGIAKKDEEKAYFFAGLAALQGEEAAAELRDEIAGSLAPARLEEVKSLLKEAAPLFVTKSDPASPTPTEPPGQPSGG